MTAVDAARAPGQVQAEASLSVLSRPGFTVARLEGDFDIASTPALRERLLSVLGHGVRLLIIDLSGVPFCDVSGLAVLIGTQRRARGLGITVRLASPRPQMAKLLRVTGLESHYDKEQVKDARRSAPTASCLRAMKRRSLSTTAWRTSRVSAVSGGWPAAEPPD